MVSRDSFSFTENVARIQEHFRLKLTQWNNELENMAISEKTIYQYLSKLNSHDTIVKELKEADALHFPEERLRIDASKSVALADRKITESPSDVLKNAFNKKNITVLADRTEVKDVSKPPVTFNPRSRTLTVQDKHPDFTEQIALMGKTFTVAYAEWSIDNDPYSLCKIAEGGKTVEYNLKHPLLRNKNAKETVKKLSLGFIIILSSLPNKDRLIPEMNKLLEAALKGF